MTQQEVQKQRLFKDLASPTLPYLKSRLHAFIGGIGSVLDLTGSAARIQRPKSDAEALRGDWEAVGNDLRKAIKDASRSRDASTCERKTKPPGGIMTIAQQEAQILNGSSTPFRVTQQDNQRWRDDGLVIVFGASDDLMEFRGAIYDELGAYNGTAIRITRDGIPENRCDCDDCPYYREMAIDGKLIKAVWGDGPDWRYETSIPHSTFDIVEDGRVYCRGIVFSIEDV